MLCLFACGWGGLWVDGRNLLSGCWFGCVDLCLATAESFAGVCDRVSCVLRVFECLLWGLVLIVLCFLILY